MNRQTYVCKRPRLCSYLMENGYSPYKIAPDRDNPRRDVYLFSSTPELYSAVMRYVTERQKNNITTKGDQNGSK